MRNIALALMLCVIMPSVPSYAAFPEEETIILEQKDLVALTDDKLVDTYVDVLSEIDASKTFHTTSGFTPKEYKRYKDLVKYHYIILIEIHRRKLELPPAIN